MAVHFAALATNQIEYRLCKKNSDKLTKNKCESNMVRVQHEFHDIPKIISSGSVQFFVLSGVNLQVLSSLPLTQTARKKTELLRRHACKLRSLQNKRKSASCSFLETGPTYWRVKSGVTDNLFVKAAN